MKIENHELFGDDDVSLMPERTDKTSGKFTAPSPRYLIMHYTAGASAESSIRTLMKKTARVSAHLVIGRDGTVTQMVPFNEIAWHAGASRWQGLKELNQHSIGIELDNAGPMDGGPGKWKSWFKRTYPDSEVEIAAHKHDGIRRGWHTYTEAQLMAALDVCELIFEKYGLLDILGHDDIAPDRKKDPGPVFPMENFRSRLVGRKEDAFEVMETTTKVNIRTGPGVEYEKLSIAPLIKGTRVEIEVRDASWFFGDVLGENGEEIASGWVHGNYLKPAGGA